MKILILIILLFPVWYALLQLFVILISPFLPILPSRLDRLRVLLSEDEKYLILRAIEERVLKQEINSIYIKDIDKENVKADVAIYKQLSKVLSTSLWK